jgi:hypothetical protein
MIRASFETGSALAAFIGAGLLLILSIIGIIHSRKVARSEELLAPKVEAAPVN